MELEQVPATPLRQLLPNPFRLDLGPAIALDAGPVSYVGRLRIPLVGPYRPWARLYRLPDGRRVWVVRCWEVDRAVRRVASTADLLAFADRSRLPDLATRIRGLDRRARRLP